MKLDIKWIHVDSSMLSKLMEQYGPEAQFIVLDFHGAVQFLDRCIEDIDNQMMQYYTPMEEIDESEVDSAEEDNILDKVE